MKKQKGAMPVPAKLQKAIKNRITGLQVRGMGWVGGKGEKKGRWEEGEEREKQHFSVSPGHPRTRQRGAPN